MPRVVGSMTLQDEDGIENDSNSEDSGSEQLSVRRPHHTVSSAYDRSKNVNVQSNYQNRSSQSIQRVKNVELESEDADPEDDENPLNDDETDNPYSNQFIPTRGGVISQTSAQSRIFDPTAHSDSDNDF